MQESGVELSAGFGLRGCRVQKGLKMKLVFLPLALLAVASATGCAGNMKEMTARFGEMDMKVQTLSRTNSGLRTRIDELENRILLLQDEVETQRLMGMRTGSQPSAGQTAPKNVAPQASGLPVLKLEPGAALPEVDYVAGSDTSEPETANYAYGEYDRAVADSEPKAVDGGTLDMSDSYQGIDDMGRVIPASGKGQKASKAKPARAVEPPPPPRKEKPADTAKKAAARALDEYKAAYALYNEGRLDDARDAFSEFVNSHPKHAYADNARYWVGECWYDRRDFEKARVEFMRVISDYPDGNKVPDAMVKVGLSDQNLGRIQDARRMYDAVILTYPDSEAAAVATRLSGKLQ
jgi:tol-pal system protein YbgF